MFSSTHRRLLHHRPLDLNLKLRVMTPNRNQQTFRHLNGENDKGEGDESDGNHVAADIGRDMNVVISE